MESRSAWELIDQWTPNPDLLLTDDTEGQLQVNPVFRYGLRNNDCLFGWRAASETNKDYAKVLKTLFEDELSKVLVGCK